MCLYYFVLLLMCCSIFCVHIFLLAPAVHVVLVTDILVLLTERDQKYHLATLQDLKVRGSVVWEGGRGGGDLDQLHWKERSRERRVREGGRVEREEWREGKERERERERERWVRVNA